MSVIMRGAKNAFRNKLRTGAVVLILAIGVGLSLSMLVAKQTVEARINDLRVQVGTTLVVNPAGAQETLGGGEPLKMADVEAIKKVPHVVSADGSINFMLHTDGQEQVGLVTGGGGKTTGGGGGKTSLMSSIDAGTLGRRNNSGSGAQAAMPAHFSLPIRGMGTNSTVNSQGESLKIIKGRALTAADASVALLGKDLAEKNNLKLGSTFTAYNTTFTIVGIFDQGTKFGNDAVAMPLAQAQQLSGQKDEVGSIVVTVDSLENLEATSAAIKEKLGASKADVVSSQQNVQMAVESLKNVQQVSLIGFIAALIAAAVITFLIMLVIVRERRREIGVLKAIGGSNRIIVAQFVVEALVLVAMSTVVGLGVAVVGSNGIANALVSNAADPSGQGSEAQAGGQGVRQSFKLDVGASSLERTTNLVGQVTASVGPLTLLWGVLAAVVIAVVGSAVPAWLIAKVRPAEVMRGE